MAPRNLRFLLPRQVRELPADLVAVLVLVGCTNLAVFLPLIQETPLRIVVGLPFVLFLPGYALVAALFPEAGSAGDADESTGIRDRGIDGIERVALSFGLSIAVVPLIGLVLNFTPWGIRLAPVALSISGFTVICMAVAAQRRWALPADERFRVPYRDWLAATRAELFDPDSRTDAALNVLLVVSLLLAAGSVGYTVAVPTQGESFTEFYLLTRNETGELVADDYPTEFERGETTPVIVGIGNHEHERTRYTVVGELQRVEVANNSTTVLEERELHRFSATLDHNETAHTTYNVTPTMTGERLRLVFLLYRGEPPPDPTIDTAYRELHLWVNVSRAG